MYKQEQGTLKNGDPSNDAGDVTTISYIIEQPNIIFFRHRIRAAAMSYIALLQSK